MQSIDISIIVPVYNAEQTIERCINSILRQTHKNIEVIIVDDGSTDSSLEMCRKFAIDDKRINIIHKSNEGVSSARNTGLKVATGHYIGFVDSDDYIEADMFERMVYIAEKYDAELVECSCCLEYTEITAYPSNISSPVQLP